MVLVQILHACLQRWGPYGLIAEDPYGTLDHSDYDLQTPREVVSPVKIV